MRRPRPAIAAAPVGGGDHVVVPGGQVDPQGAQDLRLVVDDEDAGHRRSLAVVGTGSPSRLAFGGVGRVCLRTRVESRRAVRRHGESAAGGVFRGQGAAHGLGEAAGQGEAEADAGGVVAVAEALERQEDPVPVGGGDARAAGR